MAGDALDRHVAFIETRHFSTEATQAFRWAGLLLFSIKTSGLSDNYVQFLIEELPTRPLVLRGPPVVLLHFPYISGFVCDRRSICLNVLAPPRRTIGFGSLIEV